MKIPYPLWLQVATTLLLNLTVLAFAGCAALWRQTDAGLSSFLYAPARERVRELGMRIEDEFPGVPPEERSAWLSEPQRPYGVTLLIYEDAGRLIAGPPMAMPSAVEREIVRPAENRPRRFARRRGVRQPMFLVREPGPSRFWIGYHFPVDMSEGRPPVRHTLAVVADSLLTNSFFFDWRPWISGTLAACGLTVICWLPLVRRLSSSIRSVQTASAEIARGNFDVPVSVPGRDELADLGLSVGTMAKQLAQLVHGQRRFLADVAHELCAPLSRMQLSVGILAQRPWNGRQGGSAFGAGSVAHVSPGRRPFVVHEGERKSPANRAIRSWRHGRADNSAGTGPKCYFGQRGSRPNDGAGGFGVFTARHCKRDPKRNPVCWKLRSNPRLLRSGRRRRAAPDRRSRSRPARGGSCGGIRTVLQARHRSDAGIRWNRSGSCDCQGMYGGVRRICSLRESKTQRFARNPIDSQGASGSPDAATHPNWRRPISPTARTRNHRLLIEAMGPHAAFQIILKCRA